MLSPTWTTVLSIAVLAAAALVPLALAAGWLRRSPFSLVEGLLYGLNYVLCRVLWRAEVHGTLDLPPGQGAVIVSNHRASIDPSFIEIMVRQVVHWMVAKEYCEHPAFRWFLRTCKVIPVGRAGVDTAATKLAIRMAQQGELIGIFPEGRINETDGLMLPGRPGAVMVALKARVPIVPCFIEGSPYGGAPWRCLFMTANVRLIIGRPIDLSPYYGRESERAVLQELTLRVLKEIARLGSHPDYQPRLAGRFYMAAD